MTVCLMHLCAVCVLGMLARVKEAMPAQGAGTLLRILHLAREHKRTIP